MKHRETKPCGVCGKLMIQWFTGIIRPANPIEREYVWKCGCGNVEPGDWVKDKTPNQIFMEVWEHANETV